MGGKGLPLKVRFMLAVPGRNALRVGFVAIALVLSGCSSKGDDGSAEDEDLVAPTGEHDENTCALEGIVYDDEVKVVGGAQVGLRGTDELTETAADGRFSFSHLQPGLYNVEASKAGFVNALRQIECVKGETNDDISLQLVAVPDVTEAYKVLYPAMVGKIGCGVGHFSATNDLCKGTPLATGAEYRSDLPLLPDPVIITGAVYEMQWTQTSGSGGKYLSLQYEKPSSTAVDAITTLAAGTTARDGGVIVGQSPIGIKIESGPSGAPLYLKEAGSSMVFTVRPSFTTQDELTNNPTGETSSKLVLQQDFTVYVSLFYNGEPIPDGFTALPT